MADESPLPPPEEIDPGEPVEIWTGEGDEPGDQFVGKLRRRIQRRVTSNQIAAFSWHTPGMVLLSLVELLSGIFGQLGGGRKKQ